MVNRNEETLFYTPWVVEGEYYPHLQKIKYSFPDFRKGFSILIDENLSPKDRDLFLLKKAFDLTVLAVRNREPLNPPMTLEELYKTYYDQNHRFSQVSIKIDDVIDEVYPPNILPSAREVLLLNAANISEPKKELDLNFWVVVYNDNNDFENGDLKGSSFKYTEKKYEIHFPEINLGHYHPISVTHKLDIFEKINDLLIYDLRDYMYLNKKIPRKWTREEVNEECPSPDNVFQHTLTSDDYLDLLNYVTRSQQKNILKRHWPTDTPRKWPPKNDGLKP